MTGHAQLWDGRADLASVAIYPQPKPARRAPKGRKPMRRYKRINPRRLTPRRTSQVRDEAFKESVRQLKCCAPGAPRICRRRPGAPARYRSEASHMDTDHGRGEKGHDDMCGPMCGGCHDAWETRSGQFKGWTREQRRAFTRLVVAQTWVLLGYQRPAREAA